MLNETTLGRCEGALDSTVRGCEGANYLERDRVNDNRRFEGSKVGGLERTASECIIGNGNPVKYPVHFTSQECKISAN
jgi:hypothetical protein